MKNLELFGIDRPNLYAVVGNMVETRNTNKIIVHGLGQGEGKTTLCSKFTYERVKKNHPKIGKSIDLYLIPLDQTTDYIKNQYEPVKKLCEEGYSVIYIANPKAIYSKFNELADNYNLTIVKNYKELVKEANKPKHDNSMLIGATSSQLLYFQKDNILPLLATIPAEILIDEADIFIGVTTALNYKIINENTAASFSAKFLKKVVYEILKNPKANINAFTGTPTQEQRGVVVNNEESLFKYFEYESDESTTKPLESITFLNGNRLDAPDLDQGYYYPVWDTQTIIGHINYAVKDRELNNIKTKSSNGLTMVTVGVGVMESLIERGSYANYETDMSNVIFYSSNPNIKGSILTQTGYIRVAKTLSEVKKLLENPNTPYNILVNIRAGTRGFDVPLFDTLFHVANSAKKLEQYAFSQLLGRINRVCGNKTTRLFLRMREGTVNGLKFYIERTYKDSSYNSRTIFEMINRSKENLKSVSNLDEFFK